MITNEIVVSSKGHEMEKALQEVDKVAVYNDLSPRNALHLRLLTEEMMGMMRSLTGETEGKFWIENKDNEYRLHLQVETRMDSGKRDQLLSASTSGKNESARGLMGRLRDFFDRGTDEDVASFSPMLLSGMYEEAATSPQAWEWSMMRYQSALSDENCQWEEPRRQEAWDELEKSVVAHVADEVKVSIRGQQVEMVIIKKMAA